MSHLPASSSLCWHLSNHINIALSYSYHPKPCSSKLRIEGRGHLHHLRLLPKSLHLHSHLERQKSLFLMLKHSLMNIIVWPLTKLVPIQSSLPGEPSGHISQSNARSKQKGHLSPTQFPHKAMDTQIRKKIHDRSFRKECFWKKLSKTCIESEEWA